MWFKCSEQPFTTDQPVFFGELQLEYLSVSNKSKYICLFGDFNSRTATDTDFVDMIKHRYVDDYVSDFDLKMRLNRISMERICALLD